MHLVLLFDDKEEVKKEDKTITKRNYLWCLTDVLRCIIYFILYRQRNWLDQILLFKQVNSKILK